MAKLLRGAPAAAALNKKTSLAAAELRENGIIPTLAIVRVGQKESDLSYEGAALRRCDALGIETRSVVLAETVSDEELEKVLRELSREECVDGILLFRPLPHHLDETRALRAIAPEKDVDGGTVGSLAKVYSGTGEGFAPCTARALLELLDYYEIPPEGKRVVMLGRSLVVGRPAAMLFMQRGATVTICHSRTANTAAIAREADILAVCTGRRALVGADYLRAGQVVLDAGIHTDPETGKLCGDVRFDEAEAIVDAVTPVPGGVGALTTAVLAAHTVCSAQRRDKRN